jgi:hypothetical protein
VLVDGAAVGTAPLLLPVFVDPGEHTFTARMEGWQTAKRSIVATAGGTEGIDLQLERVVAPTPAPLPTGSTASVSAPPPAVVPVHEGGPRTEVLIAGGATAGAALAAGVIFTVVANGKASDAEEQRDALAGTKGAGACSGAGGPPECAALDDAFDARDTFSNLAFWSFVGAGAIGAGTVVYALVVPAVKPTAGVRVVPVIGSQGGGLSIGGVF